MSSASATVIAPLVAIANGPVPSLSASVLPEMIETVDAVPSVMDAVMTAALLAADSASEADPSAMDRPTSVTVTAVVWADRSLVPSENARVMS